jgi:hypothetical protein
LQPFINQAVPPCREWLAFPSGRFSQVLLRPFRGYLELNMKSGWNSLVVGGCHVIGLTLLVLSATVGGSAVRAAGDSPVLESMAIESLTKLVSGLDQRVAAFEALLAKVTDSFTTARIAARELCVADDGGAQTCVTKAQLDALLKGAMQTAQTTQVTPEPQLRRVNERSACPEKCVSPVETAATAAPAGASSGELPAVREAAAPDASSMAAAAREKTPPEEAAGTVPPARPSGLDQQQARAESAVPIPGETITPAEVPAKDAKPAPAGPATVGAAAAEPNAEPAERLTKSERIE